MRAVTRQVWQRASRRTRRYSGQTASSSLTVSKANAAESVTGRTGAYDGTAHGATGSATGVSGDNLSALLSLGSTFTNVPGGTANWTFAGNDNYNAIQRHGERRPLEGRRELSCVNGFTGVYDGAAHGATGSATGVGGAALSGLVLGASFTNVPGGTATWTFTDTTGNYNNATRDGRHRDHEGERDGQRDWLHGRL